MGPTWRPCLRCLVAFSHLQFSRIQGPPALINCAKNTVRHHSRAVCRRDDDDYYLRERLGVMLGLRFPCELLQAPRVARYASHHDANDRVAMLCHAMHCRCPIRPLDVIQARASTLRWLLRADSASRGNRYVANRCLKTQSQCYRLAVGK